MKNTIQYYYNLSVDDIHQNKKTFRFELDHHNYVFLPYERDPRDIQALYEIHIKLLQNGIYCHQIILNVNQEAITIVNQIPYVLLQVTMDEHLPFTFDQLLAFSNLPFHVEKNNSLKRDHWYQLWTQKMDYFEYQVSQFGKKYPIIRDSFSYFEGMTETGIQLLTHLNKSENTLVISHRRFKHHSDSFELYNPLNFVLDLRVRDIAEYFKSRFFKHFPALDEIKAFLPTSNLTVTEVQMFFIRMLYPSEYFDLYERIIDFGSDEKRLLPILEKTQEYEQFLKRLYLYLRPIAHLPEIEWLLKETSYATFTTSSTSGTSS